MAKTVQDDRKSVMEVTIPEAAEVLMDMDWGTPLMMHGPPGIGKSAIVEQACAQVGADLRLHNLNEMEPPDLLGIPFESGKYFQYKVPYFWWQASTEPEVPEDQRGPMVLFFDDVVTASEQNQCALSSWVHARRNDMIKLRDNVRFVMAGNRVTDKSGVQPMPKHFGNRCLHLYLKLDSASWLNWARLNGVHPWCVGWVRAHPQHLNTFDPDSSDEAFATARTIHLLSNNLFKLGKEKCSSNMSLMSKVAYGLIGSVAGEFYAFVKYAEKCIPPEEIVKDPKGVRIPRVDELDILHATVSALEHYLREHPKYWLETLQYALRINPDLGLILAKQIVDVVVKKMGNAEKTKAASCPEMNEMFKRWGNFLQQ